MRNYSARRKFAAIVLAVAASGLASTQSLFAANRNWTFNGDGAWNDPTKWLGGLLPAPGDVALIIQSDAFNRNITLNVSATIGTIEIGNSGAGISTLTQSSGVAFNVFGESLGSIFGGKGVHNQSAGSNTLVGYIGVGDVAGSFGTYSLSGSGTMLVQGSGSGAMYVGTFGTGTFAQSGGGVTIGSAATPVPLFVGYGGTAMASPGTGVGSYLLSGTGSLNVVGSIYLGDAGFGNFGQTGGTVTLGSGSITSELRIAEQPGSAGAYALGGGVLNVSGQELNGNHGSGFFSQSSGTHTVGSVARPRSMILGSDTGGFGQYQLSGDGALTVTGPEIVGDVAGGFFNQSGGNHTIGTGSFSIADLILGSGAGSLSSGSYLLSGTGSLTTINGSVILGQLGATGQFQQSGGTANISREIYVGFSGTGQGTLTMSGGTLNVSDFIRVAGGSGLGNHPTGVFNQFGGVVNSNGFQVGFEGAGTCFFSGGTLNSSYVQIGGAAGGAGTFTQFGGVVNATNFLSVGESDFGGTGGDCRYIMRGGTLTTNSELIGLNGPGTFEQLSGTHTIGSIGGFFPVLQIAEFTNGAGTFLMANGSLTVNGSAQVGSFDASGFLGISGGVTTITHILSVFDSGTTAVSLSGGTLSVGFLSCPNHSRFNWTGGTLFIPGGISIDNTFGLGSDFTIPASGQLVSDSSIFNDGQIAMAGGYLSNGGTVSGGGGGSIFNYGSISGKGTITGAGGFFNNGLLSATGGVLFYTNTGLLTNTPGAIIALSPGAQLQLDGTVTLVNDRATIALNGGMLVSGGGTAQLQNRSGGLITGPGLLNMPLANNQGIISLDAGVLRLTYAMINSGNIELNGPSAELTSDAAITNASVIEGRGILSPTTLTNNATVESIGGALTLGGTITNNAGGKLVTSTGTKLSVPGGLPSNSGTVSLLGGELDAGNSTINNSSGYINGHGTIRGGSLSNIGTVSLSGGASDVFAPVTNAGRILLAGNNTASFYNDVTTSAGTMSVAAGSTLVFFGNVIGVGHITGLGVKDFEGSASAGPIATLAGSTLVGSSGKLVTDYIRDGSLGITGLAKINPNGTAAATSVVKTLTIDGSPDAWIGKLDLSDNDLIIDYTGASPLWTLQNQIKSGFNHGAWTGNGITSSLAGSGKAIGYLDNATRGLATFSGQSVDSTSILIKYTFAGDSNLDGQVDVTDLGALATNWQTSSDWTGGDFNYDGFVDVTDLGILATNWQAGVGNPLAVSQLDQAVLAVGLFRTLVPEPAAASIAFLLLLHRRRGKLWCPSC